MSRDEGFAVMDVSTSLLDDPKFRRLQRENPELVAPAVTAYVATMAESWRAGRRVGVDDAWPAILSFNEAVPEALIRVGLLDSRGFVNGKAWRGWFTPARDRRDKARDRWARYNAHRDAATPSIPRGSDAGTATSVPSVRSSSPSAPSTARGKKNGLATDDGRHRALLELSERFQRGELDEVTYKRERKAIG